MSAGVMRMIIVITTTTTTPQAQPLALDAFQFGFHRGGILIIGLGEVVIGWMGTVGLAVVVL